MAVQNDYPRRDGCVARNSDVLGDLNHSAPLVVPPAVTVLFTGTGMLVIRTDGHRL
jgi:hypothetical protein